VNYIKNRKQLLSHGNVEIRKAAIDILNDVLTKTDPYPEVKKLVSLNNNTLKVGKLTYDLGE
jgi:hypothetical protein